MPEKVSERNHRGPLAEIRSKLFHQVGIECDHVVIVFIPK